MKAILQRDRCLNQEVVFGKLTMPAVSNWCNIYTIEPLNCIQAGIYPLIGHNGTKHSNVYELQNVPNRSSILIHVGNFACDVSYHNEIKHSDTEGCILVGFGMDIMVPMVTYSARALDYIRTQWGVKEDGERLNIELEVRD